MTRKQEIAIERLKRMAQQSLFYGDEWEFKQFEVRETSYGSVMVTIETGMKGDEGTLAAIFARDYCNVFVGPRGAVTWYKNSKGKLNTTKQRLSQQRTILAAVIDQRA